MRVHAPEPVQRVIVKAVDLAALLSTCSCTDAFALALSPWSGQYPGVVWPEILGKIDETASTKMGNISDYKFRETAEVCKGKRINASRYEQHKNSACAPLSKDESTID